MYNHDWKAIDLGVELNGLRYVIVKRLLSPYKKFKKELEESQWFNSSKLEILQTTKLRRLVRYAYENVPYYRNVFNKRGLFPEHIRYIDDLRKLPILEKDDIRKNYTDMVSRKIPKSLLYRCHTSGTMGKPLTLFRDLSNIAFEYALLARQRSWAGIKDKELYATLKGENFHTMKSVQADFWKLNLAERKLVMSSYHISENNVRSYLEAFDKHNPIALDGYPSSIYALACLMKNRGVRYNLHAVLTSSETLMQSQRDLIEDTFLCKVFDYYGLAERVVAIHTCEHGRYHFIPEYGITEFAPLSSDLRNNEREIIATSLTNFAMPLLRYRVGDVVVPSNEN